LKKLIIFILIIIVCGCNKNDIIITLDMNCNDTISEVKVKYNDTLYCKVNAKEYKLVVTDISEDKIVFNDEEYILTIDKNIKKDKFELSWKK